MTRNQKLQSLFADLMDLERASRRKLLDRVRQEDPALARELVEMVEVEQGLDGFLAGSVAAAPNVLSNPTPNIPGYDDLVLVGQGGMGTVYRAHQREPVERIVAIKTIRPGIDSSQVLARFELERQALARMAHPGIATVFDAGTDDRGMPFLVMEFVDGLAITDHCVDLNLDLNLRLALFAKVCDAVDHAHRRGVLHRDIKPSNVLVACIEDVAQPKVIDFGIAKAIEEPIGEESIHTLHGALLGTPDYMSPEQIDGDRGAVDTRTDVYALGVLLYELTTGMRPFDLSKVGGVSMTEWMRILRQEIPPKPSVRLSRTGANTLESTWGRHLHGELDWVAMKALEKDPDSRYQSPRDLADDVRRFVDGRPVLAGPPSGLHRLRKFLVRHRGWVTSVLVVMLLLLAGTIAMSILAANNRAMAVRERSARIDAEAAGRVLRENLYRWQMRLASESLGVTGGVARTREIVDSWRPADGLPDLRGFEWYLLAASCQRELRVVPAERYPRELAWHPDGRIVSTHWRATIAWHGRNGHPIARWDSSVSPVAGTALSQDGRRVALSLSETLVALYDVASGKKLARFQNPSYVLRCLLSADGRLLLCNGNDETVVAWDTATGQELAHFGTDERATGGMAMSADGALFAVGMQSKTPRILVLRSRRPRAPNHPGAAGPAIKTERSATPMTGTAAGLIERELHGRFGTQHFLAMDRAGKLVASATGEGLLQVWSVASGEIVFEHQHSDALGCVAFDPAGRRVAVGSLDYAAYVHELNGGAMRRLLGHGNVVNGIAWSPDGKRLVTISDDQTMRFWDPDAAMPRRERRMIERNWLQHAELTFDGSSDRLRLHLGSEMSTVWDLATDDAHTTASPAEQDARLQRWSNPSLQGAQRHTFRFAAVDPASGTLAIVEGRGGNLWLWPQGADNPVAHDSLGDVREIAWLDDLRLATIDATDHARIFDGRTGELISERSMPEGPLSLAAHSGSNVVAIGCADQSIKLWYPASDEVFTLRGHSGNVDALAFSPGGMRLASGGRDRSVRIWDVRAHAEVAALHSAERVTAAAFSPDGTRLAILGRRGLAVVWNTRGARH